MFPFQVNESILINIIQPRDRDELYSLNRVIIQCTETNLRSRSIPERIGFVEEGISREAQWLYDHYENIVTYSMLSSEWNK